MHIAPHLVHPLPIVVPTYGHGTRGREVLWAGLKVNDLVGFDRNRINDPEKHIPKGRMISRNECLRLMPGINDAGLTGGALWYDCQMHNSERLILSVLRSATGAGADVANYVEVTGFITTNGRISGVKGKTLFDNCEIDVRAKVVVNTGGPWIDKVLSLQKRCNDSRVRLLKAMNVITKPVAGICAVGLPVRQRKHSDGQDGESSRLLFFTPWRQHTLIGTFQAPYNGDPDDFAVTETDVVEFMNQVNSAFPGAGVDIRDITLLHAGLVPMEDSGYRATADLARRYRIYNHTTAEKLEGLVSVVSVKFTEARYVSEELVNIVFEKLGKKSPRPLTSNTPVHGGNLDRFAEFVSREKAARPMGLDSDIIGHLIYNYGAEYPSILKYSDECPTMIQRISPECPVLKAEIVHGVREEMARKLTDVVFRRTDLAMVGNPGDACLASCARIMAQEVGWSDTRVQEEIGEVKNAFVLEHCHG
jgi:glycerol-3-phosphate dehydrogenase